MFQEVHLSTTGLNPKKKIKFFWVPWLFILLTISLNLGLIAIRAGKEISLIYPVSIVLLGLLIYFKYPSFYIGLVWWVWFISPLVRRFSDFYSNFDPTNPILLTPFLIVFITLPTVVSNIPNLFRSRKIYFVLPIVTIIYGAILGAIVREPSVVALGFLEWFSPVLFGSYLYLHWRIYPEISERLNSIFMWGVLVMGAYGVYQFMVSPPWDIYWLTESGFSTGGRLAPYSLNIWSTMPSNRPFGTVMMAGLTLLLINERLNPIKTPATGFGYLSFLLARKRTTWLSLIFSVLVLNLSLKSKKQMQLLISILITAALVIPLSQISPFSDFIGERVNTLSNLQSDNSANVRTNTFKELIGPALTSLVGSGIGGKSFDNGILSSLFDIGWIGTLCYFFSIIFILFSIFKTPAHRLDKFALASRAIALSTFVQLPLGQPHLADQGMVLWCFLSTSLAAKTYYSNQVT
jgi:hypothetical protein